MPPDARTGRHVEVRSHSFRPPMSRSPDTQDSVARGASSQKAVPELTFATAGPLRPEARSNPSGPRRNRKVAAAANPPPAHASKVAPIKRGPVSRSVQEIGEPTEAPASLHAAST